MAAVLHVDPGFHASGVLTVNVSSPMVDNYERFEQLLARLEALPGVQTAGGISRYFQMNTMRLPVTVVGRPPSTPKAPPM